MDNYDSLIKDNGWTLSYSDDYCVIVKQSKEFNLPLSSTYLPRDSINLMIGSKSLAVMVKKMEILGFKQYFEELFCNPKKRVWAFSKDKTEFEICIEEINRFSNDHHTIDSNRETISILIPRNEKHIDNILTAYQKSND